MTELIPDDYRQLLVDPNYGHLGTVRPDDTVQVNPMWFEFEDDADVSGRDITGTGGSGNSGARLRFTHTTKRAKFRNLQHNPSMSLSVIDPVDPFRYLEVRGRLVEVIPDPTGQFYVRLGRRYGNAAQTPPPDSADRVILVMSVESTTKQ